ncbi:MAG: phosphoribosylaminoimidazolesuccinocarboxamide synthase [Actinobacteria bacterium]|nr:phosphoribosylaminoimidazolesuccinocarboxamide synthase [Actinomycetota bacterium]
MGSVKDLIVIEEPLKDRSGLGRFHFSNRYSVFDWGEMPDHIDGKGASLCMTSAYFFEKLDELGLKSHYLGLVEDGEIKKLSRLNYVSDLMEIKLLRVIRPRIIDGCYDYSEYKKEKLNSLIPLEIIYRNSLPEGSSVFKRLENGSLNLKDIGLDKMPLPGQVLDKPILEVSTKLESTDRYIGWQEARDILGLGENEVEEIKRITLKVNKLITEEVSKVGLVNEDGKIELGLDGDGNFIVLDTIGTLDECRFTYHGLHVSKEIARIFYRTSAWYLDVENAKKIDRAGWKQRVKSKPPRLTEKLKELISQVYKAAANEITKKKWFKNVGTLNLILGEIDEILDGCSN